MKTLIGIFKSNTVTGNIYDKTIRDPYSIYIPRIENNEIKEFVHINESIITMFLYNIFINNIYKQQDNDLDNKCNKFINWINNFNGVNKSNWYVVINKMFKNNILN
jgi:hypothetical protein|tara:strand:+ start:136 stop:453 length:318 start_codon:yes stop_codon:yes gene_type:complete